MKCHIRPIRFAKISNSNRYSRFDSYSIRTQTADSQVPTITTCRYEHPCPCNCLHVTARQSRPLWRCPFSLPPHCSDSHNARTHFLKYFASAEIVPFEWAGQQTGTPLTILPPKKRFWGLQNHLRKNIEFLWVYAYAGVFMGVRVFMFTILTTRSSAIAEGPRDASCQLKSCQFLRNSAETTCTTSPEQIEVMKLEG